jgi:hypothetical protein
VALQKNGVSAVSGDFLQILMTTTERTRLEVVAAKSSLGRQENASKERQDMEVRFGELIHVDEAADCKEVSGECAQAAHLDNHVTETTSSTEDDVIQQVLLNQASGHANIVSNLGATVEEARVERRAGLEAFMRQDCLSKEQYRTARVSQTAIGSISEVLI